MPQQEWKKEQRKKWEREMARLREENEDLKKEIERLRGELEKATRAGKRQAAPFSRGEPKRRPQLRPRQRF